MTNKKIFFITSVAAVAVVIIGVALINTNKNSQQNQKAVVTANDLVGEPLADVRLKDKDGNVYDFASLKGKNVVLFFNEGLMCYPACWNQMTSFGTDARFNGDDAKAISIIANSPKEWQEAIEKMPDLTKATTLFDAGATVSKRFGLLSLSSSMHAGQLPGHTYILIDKQGIVREVFDDPNMGINNDKIIEKMATYN